MSRESISILENPWVIQHTELLCDSFKNWLGADLIPGTEDKKKNARILFEAPFVVVSATSDKEPILNYGNKTALNLWEMTWEQLRQTPGKHTAEPAERFERERFLKEVTEKGFIQDYEGIRISASGKRFKIRNAIVWNLLDPQGRFHGQAATFKDWKFL